MQHVLVYLHGFLSSPASIKAQQVKTYVEAHHPELSLVIPQLPHYPDEAVTTVRKLVSGFKDFQLGFIGSSMGGFLATHMVREFGGRAVLINPAVHPHRLLHGMLGEHENLYTGERFTLDQPHVAQLEALALANSGVQDNVWVLLQEGDETLDYRDAVEFYANSKQTVEPQGDHSFTGFEHYLPDIMGFLFPNPRP